MDESFAIKVTYQDQEYNFEASLATVGYTHKFFMMINGVEVTYEPDEERNYRAILIDQAKVTETDVKLIKAVGEKLQSLSPD